MRNVTVESRKYNSLLANCYTIIYKDDPHAWGTATNSDLARYFPSPQGRVLDLGCGYGKNVGHLLSAGAEVVAVDVCERAVELASHSYRSAVREGRLKVLHGDEDSVKGKFDLVVCSGVLVDHLEDRRLRLAARLRGLMSDDGELLVTVFGRRDQAYGVGKSVEPHTFVHPFGFPVHYFDPRELCDLLDMQQIDSCYTRLKFDHYPQPHVHETHVLVGSPNPIQSRAEGHVRGRFADSSGTPNR